MYMSVSQVIDAISASVSAVAGVKLLDVDPGASTHRLDFRNSDWSGLACPFACQRRLRADIRVRIAGPSAP